MIHMGFWFVKNDVFVIPILPGPVDALPKMSIPLKQSKYLREGVFRLNQLVDLGGELDVWPSDQKEKGGGLIREETTSRGFLVMGLKKNAALGTCQKSKLSKAFDLRLKFIRQNSFNYLEDGHFRSAIHLLVRTAFRPFGNRQKKNWLCRKSEGASASCPIYNIG